jgi:hypothetical protein
MNRNTFKLIVFSFFLALQTNLYSEGSIKIKRISGPVQFDGVPNEQLWNELEPFILTMHKPNFGSAPSEISDVRIGYDDGFLWIGARLMMEDASKIFTVTKKRDELLSDYDAFGIILDTYNDNENGVAFFTTPTGLRTDYTISNDASGGPSYMNINWNTFWDVKTSRDDKGWYVEMRIPFSSLKFKSENDLATMGLIISRNISINNETDTYPAIDPKYGRTATSKPSLAQTIEIAGARPTRPLYVSPYILGGFSRDWSLNDEKTTYVKADDPQRNVGIDIKYNINSNLTLDLTANTDFAQVEADDQQINLTRYSLSFPEKRKFFQERSSLFDFGLGGMFDNLFYSRNIGLANGNPVKIYGGTRITGRLGKWDMGFLDMQTAEKDENPGENFGVLRMRRQVINQNSYVGGIMTSRMGMNGYQNFAYGVDGLIRVFGVDYLNVKWAQTSDSEIRNKMKSLDPSFIMLNWERRSDKGFAYNMGYKYSGQEFNPGIGFVRLRGVQGANGELSYGWLPGEKSKLFSYSVNVRGDRNTRLADGELESMSVTPGFSLSTKKGTFVSLSFDINKEGVKYGYGLSDSIKINAGEYSFAESSLRIMTSQARKISLMANTNAGQFYDGKRFGIMVEPSFNISSSFNLSVMYQLQAIRFPDRVTNNSLNIHSMNMKALFMLSTKLSATVLVQYINTRDELISNFRIRYNPREGNDFYLVYNDYRCTSDRYYITPEAPEFFNKTIMVKYIHTFIL